MQPALADMGRLPAGLDDLDPRRTRKLVTAKRLTDQGLAREFSYSLAASRDEAQDDDEPRRFLGRGWLFWLALDLSLIALPVPLVVMVPPVMHCRHIEMNVGFFAGDSFTGCAVDGIKDRWALLDSRIKMLVRQSGR